MTALPSDKVFISWSGEVSQRVATALQEQLRNILDDRFWMSARDLPDGGRWPTELARQLESSCFGILVISPENLVSPWLIFEAGALSKDMTTGRVIPYLVGVAADDLHAVLSQFQALSCDREGTQRLVSSINSLSRNPIPDDVWKARFAKFWPELEEQLKAAEEECYLLSDRPKPRDESATVVGMREEILEIKAMFRQFVETWQPQAVERDLPAIPSAALREAMSLEGGWYDPETESHVYIRLVDGVLRAPYCFEGNDRLTGYFFQWTQVGDYWFGRFRWIDETASGFSIYRLQTKNEIVGWWWFDEDFDRATAHLEEMLSHAQKSGVASRLIRMADEHIPPWAEAYFASAGSSH